MVCIFFSLFLCLILYSLISKHVYLSFYSIRIASLQGNHGYFFYVIINKNNKQDKTKLEILQLSFTLLCTMIHLIVFLTLHNIRHKRKDLKSVLLYCHYYGYDKQHSYILSITYLDSCSSRSKFG